MLDRYVHGTVDRVSPEAPVVIQRVGFVEEVLGGAGNVFRNVRSLGAAASIVCLVGNDQAGKSVGWLVKREKPVESHVFVDAMRQTTVKERHVSGGHHLLRVDSESTEPMEVMQFKMAHDYVRDVASRHAVTVLSDYGKGVLSGEHANFIIAAAAPRSFTIVDPKGDCPERYSGAHLLKPNVAELEKLTTNWSGGHRITSVQDVRDAANSLILRFGFPTVVVTMGARGMAFIDSNGVFDVMPATAHRVADVTGAGDTVSAAMAVVLAGGGTVLDAFRFSAEAAGAAVERHGTVAVGRSDIVPLISDAEKAYAEAMRLKDAKVSEAA